MYYFKHFITKLSENQDFKQFTLLCTIQAHFEPYFGSHKIRNSLMLKNMQKKFFRVALHPAQENLYTPCTPCIFLIINKLHI